MIDLENPLILIRALEYASSYGIATQRCNDLSVRAEISVKR